MKCQKCNSQRVVVEAIMEDRRRVTCQECGYSTIEDNGGRRMLTGERETTEGRVLLEG